MISAWGAVFRGFIEVFWGLIGCASTREFSATFFLLKKICNFFSNFLCACSLVLEGRGQGCDLFVFSLVLKLKPKA
jgi:hypothetical protein